MNISVQSIFTHLPDVEDGRFVEQLLYQSPGYTISRVIACNTTEKTYHPVYSHCDLIMFCIQGYIIIRQQDETFALHYGDMLRLTHEIPVHIVETSMHPCCMLLIIQMNNQTL